MIRFTRLAEADLLELAEFSRDNFSDYVAERYLEEVYETVKRLDRFPRLGTEVTGQHGVRRIRTGRHFIYYQPLEGVVEILGVVHEKRAPSSHF